MLGLVRHPPVAGGVVAAGLLLTGYFLVGMPLWLAALVGGAAGLGAGLAAQGRLDDQITRAAAGMTMRQVEDEIREARRVAEDLVAYRDKMRDAELICRLDGVLALARRIFRSFEEDPDDVRKAGRFLLYMNRLLPIVERYVKLSQTEQGLKLLEEQGFGREAMLELMAKTESAFAEGYAAYLENDVVELKRLGAVMSKMMDVARIGR